MKQEMLLVATITVVVLIIVWPEIVLQAVGLLAIVAAPLGITFGGASAIVIAMFGFVLIALGRLVYTAKKAHQLLRIAHPDAASQVRVKRWL